MSSNNVNSLISSAEKLQSDNWHEWKFKMQMIFRRAGVWRVVNGEEKRPEDKDVKGQADWDGKSEEALTAIGLTVDSSQTAHIRDCTTGPEAWSTLTALYERSGRANRIMLKRQFFGYVHDTSKPMVDYISGITTLASKLKAIGVTLSEEDVTDVLIFSLASSYTHVATSLMSSTADLTTSGISSTLIEAEEQTKKDPNTAITLRAHVSNSGNVHRTYHQKVREEREKPKEKEQKGCYRCGEPGHIARYCTAPAPIETAPGAHAKVARAEDSFQLF